MWNMNAVNNTLRNGLRLLEHLAGTTDSFAVSALATSLELPKSHVHRLLQGLVEDGWVVQDGDRRYRIGLKPLELSSALLAHLPLRRAALPVMRDLAQATGHEAVLAQLFDGAVLVIASENGKGQLDPALAVGKRLPLDRSATGRLLAGYLTPSAQAQLLARIAPADLALVQAHWTRARLEHRALNPPLPGSNVASLAVPVRTREQRVCGALGLAMPVSAWNESSVAEFTEQLRLAADRIHPEETP